MSARLVLFLGFLSAFVFHSCKQAGPLPEAVGKTGSLVIVADPDVHSELKPVYDLVFLGEGSTMSTGKAFFNLMRPDPENFRKLYFNQRLLLVLVSEQGKGSMDELLEPFDSKTIQGLIDAGEPQIRTAKDVTAKNQHVVYLFGKDAADLKNKLLSSAGELTRKLIDLEIKGQNATLFRDSSENDRYFREMKDKFGIGVRIPAKFTLRKKLDNAWLFQMDETENGNPKSIGIIVQAYPYKETSDLSYPAIRSVRDSTCKYLVLGEISGTYMGTTESRTYPEPVQEPFSINDYKGTRIRSWWTIRGISMSGPYLRYVVHVPAKNLLFAFEGFVYKPGINTNEPDLRLIESIALSIR
jgi:hypothetical protein